MFRDELQRSRAIYFLLPAQLRKLWHIEQGPTDQAIDYVKHGSPLSSGESVMLRIAFDFWNDSGKADFSDLCRIDDDNLAAVTGLLATFHDPGAIDRWIAVRYGETLLRAAGL